MSERDVQKLKKKRTKYRKYILGFVYLGVMTAIPCGPLTTLPSLTPRTEKSTVTPTSTAFVRAFLVLSLMLFLTVVIEFFSNMYPIRVHHILGSSVITMFTGSNEEKPIDPSK